MLKVTVKSNVKLPESFDFTDAMKEIADVYIIGDIVQGIETSMAIDGTPLPPNEKETVMRKAGVYVKRLYTKKGTKRKQFDKLSETTMIPLGSGRPLVDTGKLKGSFYSRVLGKNKILVSISGDRKEIGGYLQDGFNTKSGFKQYRFFGISKNAETNAINVMKKVIDEVLDASGKG
jgi:hypothetical protein